jgi:hypothetical protein
MSEVALAAALTVSVAGVSYAAFRPNELEDSARTVADSATCRAVNAAIAGYLTSHDRAPRSIAELRPYVQGDISAYRIAGGVATGPGC